MYFNKFPDIFYNFRIGGKDQLRVVKDITTNVRFRKAILSSITLFDEYDIREGDTPDIIAAKYYGSSEYHWIVMLCNERFDWSKDFPFSTNDLEDYTNTKYANPNGIHHRVDSRGYIVSTGGTTVSNYQYENDVNESKRRIKLITPGLLSQIVNNFNTTI